MTIKQILRIGDPRLNIVADPISDFDSQDLHQLIEDMRDTMADSNGAGLAAPQIGVNKRLVIFAMQGNLRYPDVDTVPETVLINPIIDVLDAQKLGMWEGCLSVPGMRGYVERSANICYRGFDQFGNPIDRTVDGFHAVVVQHECDHLDGILYPSRITDLTRFGFETELEARDDYP
ncbi:MAG: peptide deformylase [Polaribacter sp.]|jgi:peptide deformylase